MAQADFVRIKGDSARRYQNTKTGEIISRHAYDVKYGKLAQEGFTGYHAKSKASKTKNAELHYSRPSRGRTSTVKFEEAQRKEIAKQRQIFEKAKAPKKIKKVTTTLLKAGRMGASIPIGSYKDYRDVSKQATEKKNHVYNIGVRVTGYKEGADREVTLTLFELHFPNEPKTRQEWDEAIEALSEMYEFQILSMAVYLAYEKAFAVAKSERAKKRKKGK